MRLAPWIHFLFLLAISLPYFINLGTPSIWDASEAFYAETSREMLASGDYVAPRFNYQIRAQKPPLTYWAILISYKIFGVTEFAVRLPSSLAAFGVILFSYALARLLFGPGAGLIAATIAAATPRIFILARRLPIDMLLLFCLTGTLYFLVRAIQKKEMWSWGLAYFCAGLGFLTKGPIAVIIPAGSFLLWILWSRRMRFTKTYPWMGIGILAAVILPWYILVYKIHGWTYIAPFFLKDNLGRFAMESMGPSRGPLYYLGVFVIDFIPWSFLAPFAIYLLWTARKHFHPLKSPAFGLPLLWCLFAFLLFSLSKNKQEYYIAPIYPAAAAMISGILYKGAKIRRKAGNRKSSPDPAALFPETPSETFRGIRSPFWSLPFGLAAFFMIVLAAFAPYILGSFLPDAPYLLRIIPSLVLIGGAVLLAWSIFRESCLHCFLAASIPLWSIYLMGALFYMPALESFRPVKRFCRVIESQSPGNEDAGSFRIALPSMVFYLRRPVFEENSYEQMTRRLQSEKRVFCLLTAKEYGYFADKNVSIYILDRNSRFSLRLNDLWNAGYFPGEELFLISNRPSSEIESIEVSSTL
jgi:4-amino-4-deoxy-L-arabinose transferase-like glycosyltransferase